MEDTSPKKNFVKRAKKKKATVIESLKIKKFPIYQPNHSRSISENAKKVNNKPLMKSGAVINLITKGPSINKLFFKNDNVSLKSGSVPKANKKMVKKFRSINIDKGENDIYNNIMIKKKNFNMKNSNMTLNYYDMDCIEKIHNLKGVTKDFQFNKNSKKSKKPNFINKNYISNDKLITFSNALNRNQIYEFYNPQKEKDKLKKPLHKIQSVNQEKREYKFSDFKVIKDLKKEEEEDDDDDESYENINPDDYREGNNIQLIEDNSFSEEKDESSSLSSDDRNYNEKKEKKKKKSDKLSNLVNKSIKNEKKKIERYPSQNNYNSNNNSEAEDSFFKNDTKFFMSPKIKSKHPSNKSLKSDAKSDYFNNNITYFNDSSNNNDVLNKNSFLGGPVNKSRIRKNISIATNSNYDYEGDIEEGYDLAEIGNKIEDNLNNLTTNDPYINIKSSEINAPLNNENTTDIHIINNKNNNENSDNMNINNIINNNNENQPNLNNDKRNNYIENSNIMKNISNPNIIKNINPNIYNQNNINNCLIQNENEFPMRNIFGNSNQSNIINIHNMNNFNSNNFIFGNNNYSATNSTHPNINNNIRNSNNHNIGNNVILSQNNINDSPSLVLNKNNLYNYQENNMINDPNYNMNNYIINNNNINSFDLNQYNKNNILMNENNQKFINYDINNNQNRYIVNNSNYFHPNINMNYNNNYNGINNNINDKLSNRNNHFYDPNNQYNLNIRNDNNMNINYLNYLNSQNKLNNEMNNNISPIFTANNKFKYNTQKKKQKKYNNFMNQNLPYPNMINLNNQNFNNHNLNQLQYNYINQNNNMNLNNNLNVNNTMNLLNSINNITNPLIQPSNLNMNPNINNPQNNKLNLNETYKMINSMGNINHLILNNNVNNNIPNKQNNHPSNKQKKQNLNLLSNEELAKQAHNLARYQNGCRYLQKRVENNQNLVPTLFFPNILGHITELSNDQFGNYYIKIIIKFLPEDMIYKLIQLIHPSIPKIGTNQYGTKVLQYLIEFLTNEKNLYFFIEKTLPHVVVLINDLNGIHIVQKLISIQNKYNQLIYNKIFESVELIAVTRDGSNFIKKLLEFLDDNNMIQLINAINKNLSIIITNQYGNYIIQNIITKENLHLKYKIIETIITNIVSYSNEKFSSNVVEKCLEVEEMKNKVIDEILKDNNFENILLNEYGNYVVQKALNKSEQNKQHIMFKLLIQLIPKLQSLPFGQKLLSKLFILYPRLSIFILNSGEQL